MDDVSSLPAELLKSPQALVSFVGLHLDNASHRRIWELFTVNRGLDRHALHFNTCPSTQELEIPAAKTKRPSYEWYAPQGILKKTWIAKHQSQLPAVVVLFFELNWNDPELTEKTRVCAQEVQKIRSALQRRSTKVCVVLVQTEASQAGGTDAVTAFCTECEISSRSLFVLGLNEQLLSAILRLESTLHELTQNYYHLEIKNVRAHKDSLNKNSHIFLMVRHQFKIGFFNEMKNDLHSAQKAYHSAYVLLLEAKCTEFNVMEVKSVAGFINYKLCRLGFRLNLAREAISQFRKHLDNFKSRTCPPELTWEHAAWQAGQAAAFAGLFLDAHKNGQQAIQTQHPGIYFQLAADYAISRRKLAEEQCSQVTAYPQPDPLSSETDFYGQRPWRPGKMEPIDMQKEKEGIEALQYRERTKVRHSQLIIALQQAAIKQFEAFKSPRMKTQVQVQMVDELMADQQYTVALQTLLPCVQMYRAESWPRLSAAILAKALKCAFLTNDVKTYMTLCLELAGPDALCSDVEKLRIRQNFQLVLEQKPPLPEPSLTGKNERASVGLAARKWKDSLDGIQELTLEVGDFRALIETTVNLPKSAKVGEELEFTLSITNHKDEAITLSEISCKMSNSRYDSFCKVSQPVMVEGNSGQSTVQIRFSPLNSDVGKVVRVQSVVFQLESVPKFTFVKQVPERKMDNSAGFWEADRSQDNSEVQIVTRDSRVEVRFLGQLPVLVGEWFDLKLELVSKEDNPVSDIEVVCWLRDGADPLIGDTTCISLVPAYPTTPTTPGGSELLQTPGCRPSVRLDSLAPGQCEYLSTFLAASTPGQRVVAVQLRYTALLGTESCATSSIQLLEIPVIPPFTCSTSLLTMMLEDTQRVNTDENFVVVTELSCSSPHHITVLGTRLDSRSPLSIKAATLSVVGAVIGSGAKLEECFPAIVHQKDLSTQYEIESVGLGRYVFQWRRSSNSSANIVNESVFDLGSVKVHQCFLGVECRLPAHGVLRTPVPVRYNLSNRTGSVQEFSLTMEPSDSFMFSGPKQLKLKLFPWDGYQLHYVFYPLIAGTVGIPRLKLLPLTSGGVASLDKCSTVDEILSHTLPVSMVVVPLPKCDQLRELDMTAYELSSPVVVPNPPFAPFAKKTVKG